MLCGVEHVKAADPPAEKGPEGPAIEPGESQGEAEGKPDEKEDEGGLQQNSLWLGEACNGIDG